MAIRVNEQQFVDRWASGLKGSTQRIVEGVQNVQVSPTAKAAKSLDKAKAGYTAAIDSGKMARKLNAVSLESWKASTLAKAPQRISAGVDGAVPKMQEFARKLLPYLTQVQAKVQAMPNISLEDNIQRAVTQMREMAKFDPSK